MRRSVRIYKEEKKSNDYRPAPTAIRVSPLPCPSLLVFPIFFLLLPPFSPSLPPRTSLNNTYPCAESSAGLRVYFATPSRCPFYLALEARRRVLSPCAKRETPPFPVPPRTRLRLTSQTYALTSEKATLSTRAHSPSFFCFFCFFLFNFGDLGDQIFSESIEYNSLLVKYVIHTEHRNCIYLLS